LNNETVSVRKRLIGQPIIDGKNNEQINNIKLKEFVGMVEKELEGFPRKELPQPFRYYTKRILFRQ